MVALMYLESNGKAYRYFRSMEPGYFVTSDDKESMKDGFVPYETKYFGLEYRKYFQPEEITQIYELIDTALYKGQEFSIFSKSDDNFDKPDSSLQFIVEDKQFLIDNGLEEGAGFRPGERGVKDEYITPSIPASEVAIIRRRQNIPIEGK